MHLDAFKFDGLYIEWSEKGKAFQKQFIFETLKRFVSDQMQ